MGAGGRCFRFGDYRLDSSGLLERQGARVPLGPKAIDILLALVEKPGELVTREELSERLWGDVHVVESNLSRQMSGLRKALEDSPDVPLIETVPKRGYRFVAPVMEDCGGVRDEIPAEPGSPARRQPRGLLWTALLTAGAVATAIGMHALSLSVSAERTPPPASDGTGAHNAEAERSYRIARYISQKVEPAEMVKALHWYERALLHDPRSGSALAGLAHALVDLSEMGGRPAAEALSRAAESARRAIELEPRNALAHAALGRALLYRDWDWSGAESELRLAVRLDPKSPEAHYHYACLLTRTGRFREAAVMIAAARQVDPASPLIATLEARLDYFERQYERAAERLRAVLEQEPSFQLARYYLALAYGQLGYAHLALEQFEKVNFGLTLGLLDRGWAHASGGDSGKAEEILRSVRDLIERRKLKPSAAALLLTALNRDEEAISALELAFRERSPFLLGLKSDPRWDRLRGNPRFAALLRNIGLS